MSGGSLSYNYQVTQAVLHWGEGEEGGSEHSVGGHAAALELQLLGYNGQLYSHHSLAAKSPNGVVGIAILAKVGVRDEEYQLFITKYTVIVTYIILNFCRHNLNSPLHNFEGW